MIIGHVALRCLSMQHCMRSRGLLLHLLAAGKDQPGRVSALSWCLCRRSTIKPLNSAPFGSVAVFLCLPKQAEEQGEVCCCWVTGCIFAAG